MKTLRKTEHQLEAWETQGEQKRLAVKNLFCEVAPTYDRFNWVNSAGLHQKWRAKAVQMLCLQPSDEVLDLCCGTGDFVTHILRQVQSEDQVIGADNCESMLKLARKKHPFVRFDLADAVDLPYEDERFDKVTVGWGIRNTYDIDRAHQEIARVLKPGGRFVSIDMAIPQNRLVRLGRDLYAKAVIPLLGACLGASRSYTYLGESTERFLTRDQLKESMKSAGFSAVSYQDLYLGNLCMHFGVKGCS